MSVPDLWGLVRPENYWIIACDRNGVMLLDLDQSERVQP